VRDVPVKMIELIVRDRNGNVVNRVAVNEELFKEYTEKLKNTEPDLFTRWAIRLFTGLFTPTSTDGYVIVNTVDTGGTARSTVVKAVQSNYPGFLNTELCSNRHWIGVGTSSVAPTRDDYRLGAKLIEGIAGVTGDETTGIVTVSASFSFTAETTIYEVGLEWECTTTSYSTCGRILLDRTVFPAGITIPAGGTLSIAYRFKF